MDGLLALLEATDRVEADAVTRHGALRAARTDAHLLPYNCSVVAPNARAAETFVAAAAAVSRLDSVVADARVLTGSLASLSSQAESAVRRVRELDGLRARLQSALDRVEDLSDLQACLTGVHASIEARELERAALHISRFRSIEKVLPVPDSDAAVMRDAETTLLGIVTQQFDDALAENQRLQARAAAGAGDAVSAADGGSGSGESLSAASSRVSRVVSQSCQIMGLLGHSDMGLARYVDYLSQALDADCRRELHALATTGVDLPAASINATSAIFQKAVSALEQALTSPLAAAAVAKTSGGSAGGGSGDHTGGDDAAAAGAASAVARRITDADMPVAVLPGTAALVVAVHAVADKQAAKIIRSAARSRRMLAALAAREHMALQLQQAALGIVPAGGAGGKPPPPSAGDVEGTAAPTPAQLHAWLTQVDDDAVEAPFAPLPPGGVAAGGPAGASAGASAKGGAQAKSVYYGGVAYTEHPVMDALLDETALLLQRCTSYARVMAARAAAVDAQHAKAGGSGGLGSAADDATAAASCDAALRRYHRLRDAVAELGGRYSGLEQTRIAAAVARAIGMDELVEDGVAGASIDMTSGRALAVLLETGTAPAPAGATAAGGAPTSPAADSLLRIAAIYSGEANPLPSSPAAAALEGEDGDGSLFGGASGPGGASGSTGGGGIGTGAGAMINSFVEDAYYVVARAVKRAVATGTVDCVAGVINHAVLALAERTGAELAARLRVALEDAAGSSPAAVAGAAAGGPGDGMPGSASGGLFSIVLPPSQLERLTSIRNSVMGSTPVRAAAARLAQLQAVPPPGGAAASPGSSTGGAGTPQRAGAGGAGDGSVGTLAAAASSGFFAGLAAAAGSTGLASPLSRGGGGGGSGASSAAAAGGDSSSAGPSGGMASPGPSHLPQARLTEEVAAACLALNNLQLAVACTVRLRFDLESQIAGVFGDAKELAKLRGSAAGLWDVFSQLRRHIDTGITTLCSRLTPRLRTLLNVFEGASSLIVYDMNEAQFNAAADGLNAFSTEFLPVLSSILVPYQYSLTRPLWYIFVAKVAAYLSKNLEVRLRRKRYSVLGALQLDSDVRALCHFFVDRGGSRVLRERFSRLLHMAQLLNVTSLEDAVDLWGSIAPSSQLTADEVRATLALRTDFKSQDVAKLKL